MSIQTYLKMHPLVTCSTSFASSRAVDETQIVAVHSTVQHVLLVELRAIIHAESKAIGRASICTHEEPMNMMAIAHVIVYCQVRKTPASIPVHGTGKGTAEICSEQATTGVGKAAMHMTARTTASSLLYMNQKAGAYLCLLPV